MAGFGGAVKLTGESEYRKALKSISQDLKEVSAETKLVSAQYATNSKSLEALTAKEDALNKQLDLQAKKVKVLDDQYKTMSSDYDKSKQQHEALLTTYDKESSKLADIARESGTTSDEYKAQAKVVSDLAQEVKKSSDNMEKNETTLSKMRTELTNATTDMTKTENEIKSLDKDLESLDKEEIETGKDSKALGKDVKTSGDEAQKAGKGGFTVLKGILANLGAEAVKAIPKALIDGVTNLGKAFGGAAVSVAEAGDTIDKESKKAQMSAEGYQEWSYIMERNGASIDGVKSAMLKLTKASESNNKAFKELGISSKDLKNMNAEETFNATIKALQNIEDEEKRTVLATKLLGKQGVELGSLLSSSAEDTEALRQKVHDLGGVMSEDAVKNSADFSDSLTDIKTSIEGVKNNLISQFLPSLSTAIQGLTGIFSGSDVDGGLKKISEGVSGFTKQLLSNAPKILEVARTIITSLLTALSGALPQIASTLGQIINDSFPVLTKLIQEGLPVVADAIGKLLVSLGQQLPTIILQIFDALENVITQVTSWLTEGDNLEKFIDSIIDLVSDIANRLGEILPVLLPAIVKIISSVALALTKPENVEKLIKAVIAIAKGIFNALVNTVPVLIDFIKGLFSNMSNLLADFFALVVPKVADGIGKIIDKIRTWGANVKKFFTDFFTSVKDKFVGWINGIKDSFTTGFTRVKDSIRDIIIKVGGFCLDIFNKINELPKKFLDIGKNAIQGLWNGIQNMKNWVIDKVKGFGTSILNGIKGALGIHSPSTVFRDQVGKNIALGIGQGFSDEMNKVSKDMQDDIPVFDVDTNSKSGALGAGGLSYQSMVTAFKEALGEVEVVLDDRQVGRFVQKTVEYAIYT